MTNQKLTKEYQQWIKDEKTIADNLYKNYKSTAVTGLVPVPKPHSTMRLKVARIATAAILVLALGLSVWIKRDVIFKPNYTQEQINLAYQHAVKSLAECAQSLDSEMNKLQKLNEIPKTLDNINKLENIINK